MHYILYRKFLSIFLCTLWSFLMSLSLIRSPWSFFYLLLLLLLCIYIGKSTLDTHNKAETPTLWSPDAKATSLEKTLMLRKIEGKRRRGQQKLKWLDGTTNSMDMSLVNTGRQWGTGKLACCRPWDSKESDVTQQLNHSKIDFQASQVNPAANIGDTGGAGLISGPGRTPEERNGNPFQYSCLENSIDRGAWWARVHGTWLRHWTCTYIDSQCLGCKLKGKQVASPPTYLLVACAWKYLKMKTKHLLTKYMRLFVLWGVFAMPF